MLRPMGAQPTHVQEEDVKDANKVTEEEYDEEGIVNIAAEQQKLRDAVNMIGEETKDGHHRVGILNDDDEHN